VGLLSLLICVCAVALYCRYRRNRARGIQKEKTNNIEVPLLSHQSTSTGNQTVSEVVIHIQSKPRDDAHAVNMVTVTNWEQMDIHDDDIINAMKKDTMFSNSTKPPGAMSIVPAVSDSRRSLNDEDEVDAEHQVKQWLENEVELPQYYAVFREHGVEDLYDVQDLSKTDLREMGVAKIAHQNRIIRCARQIQADADDMDEKEGALDHEVTNVEQLVDRGEDAEQENKAAEEAEEAEEQDEEEEEDDSDQSDPFYDEHWAVNKVTNYIGISQPNDLDGAYAMNKNSKTPEQHQQTLQRFGNIEKFVMDPYSGDSVLDRIDQKIAKIHERRKQETDEDQHSSNTTQT